PVDVDSAAAHGLERALHADRADIDVPEHGGDEQHRHDAVHDLGKLHARDVGPVERKHEEIARDRHQTAAHHDNPVDHLLAGVEPACRRMPVADNATAGL